MRLAILLKELSDWGTWPFSAWGTSFGTHPRPRRFNRRTSALASTPAAARPRRAMPSPCNARKRVSASQFVTQKYVCRGADPWSDSSTTFVSAGTASRYRASDVSKATWKSRIVCA
jgi:hypothetical protein